MVFLHGNVAVGYCEEDNIAGNAGRLCRCGKPFKPTKFCKQQSFVSLNIILSMNVLRCIKNRGSMEII